MDIHSPPNLPEAIRRENDALFAFFAEAAAESHGNPDWPPPVVVGVAGHFVTTELDALAAELGDRDTAVAVMMAYAYEVGRKAERAGMRNIGKTAVAGIMGGPPPG